MRIVPGASPVCSATSRMLSPSAIGGAAIVTGTDDATAWAHPVPPAPRSQDMTNVLLTGATGYVGGHLAPELLRRGLDVRCLVRDPRRAALPAGAKLVQGDVLEGAHARAGARRHRRRLLPRPLDGRRRRWRLRRARSRRRRRLRAGGPRRGRRADRLPRRPGGRRVRAPAQPRGGRGDPGGRGAGHRPRARRDGHRRRQRLVPDPAPPRRPPARDGLPALDRHAHPAHRDPRRRRRTGGARRPGSARARARSSSAAPTSSATAT